MIRTAFCCALLALSSSAALADAPRLSTPAPAALPFARQHFVTSAATGRSYRIQVSPVGKAPAGGYPLVLVLDGDIMLPAVATAAQGMHMAADENGVGPMLVVGVGYDKAELLDEQARAEDYTPPAADLSQTGDTRATKQGGADRFLRFLRDELKPAIADAYPVDASAPRCWATWRPVRVGRAAAAARAGADLCGLQPSRCGGTGPTSRRSWSASPPPACPPRACASPSANTQTPSPRIDAQVPRARMMAARGQVRHAPRRAERLREHQPQVAVEFGEYPQATHATSALYGIADGRVSIHGEVSASSSATSYQLIADTGGTHPRRRAPLRPRPANAAAASAVNATAAGDSPGTGTAPGPGATAVGVTGAEAAPHRPLAVGVLRPHREGIGRAVRQPGHRAAGGGRHGHAARAAGAGGDGVACRRVAASARVGRPAHGGLRVARRGGRHAHRGGETHQLRRGRNAVHHHPRHVEPRRQGAQRRRGENGVRMAGRAPEPDGAVLHALRCSCGVLVPEAPVNPAPVRSAPCRRAAAGARHPPPAGPAGTSGV